MRWSTLKGVPLSSLVLVGASGWLGSAIASRFPQALQVRTRESLADVLASAGPQPVIVNAAGRSQGSAEHLWSDNVELVRSLLDRAAWLVQLGSAAEYGLSAHSPIGEAAACDPGSDYGRSKLAATDLALSSGRATVLRLFNVIDAPPRAGSPIADIWQRICRGVDSDTAIEVLSGGTVRDYVSRDFVVRSVAHAVAQRPSGVFNVGSGIPVAVRDVAQSAVGLLGSAVPVMDLAAVPASVVYSNPDAWARISGLREHLDADAVAQILLAGGRAS